MQSFFAFCSLCLQFSSLKNQSPDLLSKKDEACTLCLVDMLQPAQTDNPAAYNRSSHEIINDGLYFNNPLLHDALKLKMEQKFLVPAGECPDIISQQTQDPEPVLDVVTQKEVEEALKPLLTRLEKLPLNKKAIRDGFEDQKNSYTIMVKRRIKLIQMFLNKAKADAPNKLSMPEDLYELFPRLEGYAADILDKVIPEQLEKKISGFDGKTLKDLEEFSQKIREVKSKIAQTQSPQELYNIVQEINLVHNQTLTDLEQQYKLHYKLDKNTIFGDFYPKTKEMISQVRDYLKPIKTSLKVGEKLTTNQQINSINGIFRLVLKEDGTLILYEFEKIIWQSDKISPGAPPELLLDPQDGVLKIQAPTSSYSKSLSLKNPSYTGNGEAYLTITNAGEIKIIESGIELWTPLWTFPAERILRNYFYNRYFIVSENERYTFVQTPDCYLILYDGAFPIWMNYLLHLESRDRYCQTHLNNGRLTSRSTPDIIFIDPGKTPKGETYLMVKNDGMLAIMDGDQELWVG